jgi:hypothetical protein
MLLVTTPLDATTLTGGWLWEIEVVEEGRDNGVYTSIALDRQGREHLAYVDRNSDTVKYAVQLPDGWDIQAVDARGEFTERTNLVLDHEGRPHLSYFSEVRRALVYAVRNDSRWDLRVVDAPVSQGSHGLSVDAQGNPHLAYSYLNTRLRYARWNGLSWLVETLDPETIGTDSISLALDRFARPHIAYQGTGILRYAFWDGLRWNLEVVDESEGVDRYPRLVVDSDGAAHLAYKDPAGEDVLYGRRTASSWTIVPVDREGDAGRDLSLSLGPGDVLHIAYYERLKSELRYARGSIDTWAVDVVDSEGTVGWYTALAVDADGNPHISYYDWSQGRLKVAVGMLRFAVGTLPASDVAPTTANLRGDLLSLGGFPQAEVFFEWRPIGESAWRATEPKLHSLATPFETTLTDLVPGQEYEFRARGDAADATATGAARSFRTPLLPDREAAFRQLVTEIAFGVLAVSVLVLWGVAAARDSLRKGGRQR